MTQLNITLNQEEILQLLSKDHDRAFRELLCKSLNSILMAESTAQLKTGQKNARTAARYSRTQSQDPDRQNHLNRAETPQCSF